jgi:hypothetical protein
MKEMFIMKSGKSDYTEPKAYHPVSLSFLLKTLEKLVDGILKEHPLHQNQFAYHNERYIETALQNMATQTEIAVKHK